LTAGARRPSFAILRPTAPAIFLSLATLAASLGPVPPARAAAPAGDDAPAPAALPWVNPARCLPVCAANPSGPLLRLDDRAAPSPRGKHRVDAAAAGPLAALLEDASAAGFRIRLSSAYRSYREQTRLFRSIKERGRAARPGHSEHQLGTAIDLRLPSTSAIDWLAAHAFAHGFALSYPPGKQRLTGYRPEPWHVRFVGRALAAELHDHGWTLEELFRARPGLGQSGSCDDCPAGVSRAPCGRVTVAGACQGTVLTWCYDGALAAVDCATSDQTCSLGAGDTATCR
jgi:D-alanyl-D-alanine carboxypeptidase